MKALCVYCGSNPGHRELYGAAAEALGRTLAAKGIGLMYGGAAKGLMGRLADAVLAAGGEVQGVIPHSLMKKEIAHPSVTRLHVVNTMHERKALMAERAEVEGFLKPEHRRMLVVEENPEALLSAFERYRPTSVEKWM